VLRTSLVIPLDVRVVKETGQQCSEEGIPFFLFAQRERKDYFLPVVLNLIAVFRPSQRRHCAECVFGQDSESPAELRALGIVRFFVGNFLRQNIHLSGGSELHKHVVILGLFFLLLGTRSRPDRLLG
jgi:hypothetical protein